MRVGIKGSSVNVRKLDSAARIAASVVRQAGAVDPHLLGRFLGVFAAELRAPSDQGAPQAAPSAGRAELKGPLAGPLAVPRKRT